ncbi:triose-phosphate isomerase [Patescibacteria group bacterium]
MIWLSLKTYPESTADKVIKLLKIVKKVSAKNNVPIIPCAQATDIFRIKKELGIEVWAQHCDPIDPGRNSGWISPHSLKQAGATGTVLNHGEHPIKLSTIKVSLEKAHQHGLKTLVICETTQQAKKVSLWKPKYIAYEKAKLIAGPISMIDVEESNIKKLAKTLPQPLIVGAGITSKEHVSKTLAAGGKGVILASAVIKALSPEKKLLELASGFN